VARTDDASTILTGLLDGDRPARDASNARIFIEALLFSALSLAIARFVAGENAGVVSVFLVATALNDRLRAILAQNRDDIHVEKLPPFRVNRTSAAQFFAIFLGMIAAYAGAAVLLGPEETTRMFRFALEGAHADASTILTRRFGTFTAILGHNTLVLLGFAVLSAVFWTTGALLALAWNASIWATVIAVMVNRALGQSSGAAPIFIAGLATLPHLFLEAFAYVLASLAAIFASRGFHKYSVRDPIFRRVVRAALEIGAAAFVLVTLAALAEAYLMDGLR
jgi:hypothetical protein